MQRALVIGGAGGLGRFVVQAFRRGGWTVTAADLRPQEEASDSIVFEPGMSPKDQVQQILERTGGEGAQAVVSTAGGFSMGAIDGDDLFETVDHMFQLNLASALVASHVATKTLTQNGLVVLHGAIGALHGTPDLIGYGMSKAATHHLIKSLAVRGLPTGGRVVGVLPGTINTPGNREAMPDADKSSWTPPEHIADKILEWARQDGGATAEPASGSLVQAITKQGDTTWVHA